MNAMGKNKRKPFFKFYAIHFYEINKLSKVKWKYPENPL